MSLLLLFAGGGSLVPLVTTAVLGIAHTDEAAVGAPTQVWASFVDNTGSATLPVEAQLYIYKVNADGTLDADVFSAMTPEGDGFTYDWTPTEPGTFLIAVAADDGSATHQATSPIAARPKFDPIALALHDTLVSRF